MNAIILGWGNYYGFNQIFIWTKGKPKLNKKTGIDPRDVKMRTTPLYTPFLDGCANRRVAHATDRARDICFAGLVFPGCHSRIRATDLDFENR
jgi:hypothetical protein